MAPEPYRCIECRECFMERCEGTECLSCFEGICHECSEATALFPHAEESPHLNLGKMTGEIYISCAEHDELAPPDMVAELRRLFDASGVRGEMEIQPGVHHGFAFPDRWCYDKPAAERHWERLIALYRRSLH